MSRSLSRSQHVGRARQQHPTSGPMLVLHTMQYITYEERRTALCDSLIDLARSWRGIDSDDESAWAAYAADVARDLACRLGQHAGRVQLAADTGNRVYRSAYAVGASPNAEEARGAGTCSLADGNVRSSASSDVAADAAVISLLAVVDALAVYPLVLDTASGTLLAMDACTDAQVNAVVDGVASQPRRRRNRKVG